MSKILVIAEKPSVARDIALALGKVNRKGGYLEVDKQYIVTWAIGHLVQLADAESYGVKKWSMETLPILPNPFKLVPNPKTKPQLDVIKGLKSQCVEVVCATDAGREGELIFRLIYDFLDLKMPIKRLWISSYTKTEIKEGFKNLKKGSDFERLYLSAKCRSEADWLVGINATRAFTLQHGSQEVYSLGRVQTPVLSLIAQRDLEVKNFESTDYWQFSAIAHEMDGKSITPFEVKHPRKFDEEYLAEGFMLKMSEKSALAIDSVEDQAKIIQPPLLFDLTSLQREANKMFGFSASDTLNIAQSLYEKHKVVTYPRTDSNHITDQMYSKAKTLMSDFVSVATDSKMQNALSHAASIMSQRPVNAEKVTDHHAIIPTENAYRVNLSGRELQIFNLIMQRFCEAFSDSCMQSITKVTLEDDFFATGIVTVKKGWKGLFESAEKKAETVLPDGLKNAKIVSIKNIRKEKKKTQPPKQYTEATLLTAMENAGKEVASKEERQAIKGSGLGTPATRASIIENLLSKEYIKRSNKTVVATPKGLSTFDNVKDLAISKAELTAKWELALDKMAKGEGVSAEKFSLSTARYATDLVVKIKSMKIGVEKEKIGVCPNCREGELQKGRTISCTKCDFQLFPSTFKYEFSVAELQKLLSGEKLFVDELIGKYGKSKGNVSLEISTRKYQVDFISKEIKKESVEQKCPKCQSDLFATEKVVKCTNKTCGFLLFTTISGTLLTSEQIKTLLKREVTDFVDLTSKQGKPFKAQLALSEDFKVAFKFD